MAGFASSTARHPSLQLKLSDFELGPVLGTGTVGTIYAANRKRDGRQLALKLLLPQLSQQELIVSRFEREMVILEQLNHPHIIRYYGGGDHQGQLFFVMERVDGGSLRELLQQQQRLSWQEAATIGRQLASALQHAHNHGIVHRDVKPSNLLLTRQGQIKLSDFGIARDTHAADLTDAGLTVGSHAYMSPEQITGQREITGKTDLYSMGCLLYEVLTGAPPFQAEHFAALFEQHLKQPPPPFREQVEELPSALEALVLQLLAKRADERPFNARAVQAALMRAAEARPLRAQDPADAAGDVAADDVAADDVSAEGVSAEGVFAEGERRLSQRLKHPEVGAAREVSWLRLALVISWGLIGLLVAWLLLS